MIGFEVYAYLAIILLLIAFLSYIIKLAQERIDEDVVLHVQDDFIRSHGYTHDFVLVFPVYDEKRVFPSDKDDLSVKYSFRNVAERIRNAQLDSYVSN